MAKLLFDIELPSRFLGQRHGLWTSAYHLIHPRDTGQGAVNSDHVGEEHPETTSWGRQNQTFINGDPLTGSQLGIWNSPNSPKDIRREALGGITFQSDCVPFGGLGCFGSACDDTFNDQQPGAIDPAHENNGCCVDGIDADGVHRKKGPCQPGCVVEYAPAVMYARRDCSTFGHEATDYWQKAADRLFIGREAELERRLWSGDCIVDADGNTNAYLTRSTIEAVTGDTLLDAELVNPGGMNESGNIGALAASAGLSMIDSHLSRSNSEEAGMIHASIEVVSQWMSDGLLYTEVIDYGDGMGERSVLRTKARGNIVVAGAGYGTSGPDAFGEPGLGLAWIYATPMVNLIWDKVSYTPTQGDASDFFNDNRAKVVAEQLIGAFYDPCTHLAALVHYNC